MGSTGNEIVDDMTERVSISSLQNPTTMLHNEDLEQLPNKQRFREAAHLYPACCLFSLRRFFMYTTLHLSLILLKIHCQVRGPIMVLTGSVTMLPFP